MKWQPKGPSQDFNGDAGKNKKGSQHSGFAALEMAHVRKNYSHGTVARKRLWVCSKEGRWSEVGKHYHPLEHSFAK